MPKSTSAHETRRRAEALLSVLVPPTWVLHKIDGSDDYGVDYYVETVGPDKQLTGRDFLMQLKGHQRGTPKRHGTNYNNIIRVRSETVEYWKQKLLPVLLMLVDIEFGPETPQAYYHWITRDQIRQYSAKTMSIRVWEPFQVGAIEAYLSNDFERLKDWLNTNHDYNLVRLMRLTLNLDSFLRIVLAWPSIANRAKATGEWDIKSNLMYAVLTWHLEVPDNWPFLEDHDQFADLGEQQRKLHEMLHEITQRRHQVSAGDFWIGFGRLSYFDEHFDEMVDCIFDTKNCIRRYLSLLLWSKDNPDVREAGGG